MKIGDIFYLNDYAEVVKFCNENGLQIKEIEEDEKGRRFQIKEVEALSEIEKTEQEILTLKEELSKIKEDVEQVELFGMERADYKEKKLRCKEIVLKLRELEATKK